MAIGAPFYVRRVIKDEQGQPVRDKEGNVETDDSDTGTVQDWTILPMPVVGAEPDAPPENALVLMVSWEKEACPALVVERPTDVAYVELEEDDEEDEDE
jgi:hypothetical protein